MLTLPTELCALLAVVIIMSGYLAVEIIRALAAIIRELITRR